MSRTVKHRVIDPGRVHFTHHLCIAHREGPLDGRGDGSRGDIVWSHREEWHKEFGYTHGRHPDYWCKNSTRVGEGSPKFTNIAGEVTCKICREKNKRNTERAWKGNAALGGIDQSYYENWRSDEELTICCWWVCCRHRGAPSPFATPAEERRYVLDRRAKAILKATHVFDAVATSGMKHESVLPGLRARVDKLDPDDQRHLARFLEEAALADALLEQAKEAFVKLDELARMAALCVQHPRTAKTVRTGKRSDHGLRDALRSLKALQEAA